ncbi:hypothetical protein [Lactobacillus amylolyticus]|nr:hypothetical protein [Lactobacillus amylolyticus]
MQGLGWQLFWACINWRTKLKDGGQSESSFGGIADHHNWLVGSQH